jgi:hypothetical protein
MEPERGANGFFGQVMRPIVTPNVQQFVTGNRGLESRVHGWEAFGQQNCGRRETESDGRVHIGGEAELGTSIHLGAHFFENGSRFSKRGNWRRRPAKLAKFQKAQGQDYEARGDSYEQHDTDNLGDDLNAREMPVRSRERGPRNTASSSGIR